MDIFPNNFDQKEHFVHFYDKESSLLISLSKFFDQDTLAVIIATPKHLRLIKTQLSHENLKKTNLVFIDAKVLLSKFMDGEMPNKRLFNRAINDLIKKYNSTGKKKMKFFGDLVSILWDQGNKDGAYALEELWNKITKNHHFALYCAYPTKMFNKDLNIVSLLELNGIIEQHKWANLK